jgi:catechol 2,3-dioxygenase-like lactoylglutathione lyase family enzyme
VSDAAACPAGVRAMRPFVPARDFAKSRDFYAHLGFTVHPLGEGLASLSLGDHAFLLQDFFVQQWAENFMMHVLVDDLDAWWAHIASLDLPARFGVQPPRPPKPEPWGLRVAYVFDPCGVLWHFAEPASG